MIAPLAKALTSRAAGPVASAVALGLAVLLATTWTAAARREAGLQAQVGALTARNAQSGIYWRAKLSACRAEAAEAATAPSEVTRVASAESRDVVAARLASQGPSGFDVCARMEAADQAVLASLRAK